MFDSRVFNIPKQEIINNLIWRQQDATRNSISSTAQANFSHKSLHGLSSNEMQDKLFKEAGVNWNDMPTHLKRGPCCYKVPVKMEKDEVEFIRNKWIIDLNIPAFTEDRKFVEDKLCK